MNTAIENKIDRGFTSPDLPKSSVSPPLRRILEVSYWPARKAAVPGHGCPGKAAFARTANQAVCVAGMEAEGPALS